MKTTIHRANSRGSAHHGWLHAQHSFSFGDYYDPVRMGFGLLRVLNDDRIEPSQGFGTHPHRDMEIITVPLKGSLSHKDSEGNEAVIEHGEIQAMSAGSGVLHSEYNPSDKEQVNLLQIWVQPEKLGIAPRYDQRKFPEGDRQNRWQTVVGPLGTPGDYVQINQQAYFSLGNLDKGKHISYALNRSENGVYLFVIEGEIEVGGNVLKARDAVGVEQAEQLEVQSLAQSQVLVIEVPMS